MYIDGSLVTTKGPATCEPPDVGIGASTAAYLARSSISNTDHFIGRMADVRFYSRRLTDAEVATVAGVTTVRAHHIVNECLRYKVAGYPHDTDICILAWNCMGGDADSGIKKGYTQSRVSQVLCTHLSPRALVLRQAPTIRPTRVPTLGPTRSPSFSPTGITTKDPTFSPSVAPTTHPTTLTQAPTVRQTRSTLMHPSPFTLHC
jgi:hypothetical protein